MDIQWQNTVQKNTKSNTIVIKDEEDLQAIKLFYIQVYGMK